MVRKGGSESGPPFLYTGISPKEEIGSHMGGIGNVVVNTLVRTFTRKTVGKAMKTARSTSGKRKKGRTQERIRKGQARHPVSLPGVGDRGRDIRWIVNEAREKKRYAGKPRSVLPPTLV